MTLAAETGREAALRGWLTTPSPHSSLQARAQRGWFGWMTFRANPIAMTGLIIIVALVLAAIFAPLLTATNGIAAAPREPRCSRPAPSTGSAPTSWAATSTTG